MRKLTGCFFLACILLCQVAAQAQDEEDYSSYGVKEKGVPFLLKTGGGIGAAYGGWFGVNTEVGYGFVSLVGAVGGIYPSRIVKNTSASPSLLSVGWQTGVRVYVEDEDAKARFALSIYYGPVYLYHLLMNGTSTAGIYYSFTPTVSCEHDIGKKRGLVFSYGLGAVLHKEVPDDARNTIKAVLGKDINALIDLSLVLGVNYQF
jgi:hypothetical protein